MLILKVKEVTYLNRAETCKLNSIYIILQGKLEMQHNGLSVRL